MSHSALSKLSKSLALSLTLCAFPQAQAANINAPSLVSILHNPTNDAAYNIIIDTPKGTRTFLQGSPNTTNWINLASTSTNGGTYTLTDTPLAQDRSFFYRAVAERTQGNLAQRLADDDPFLGSTNALITIVEFGDYQCPFSDVFNKETFPRIRREYIDTGKVRFIYRDFPILELHPNAISAALSAESVRVQGGNVAYWKMHDILFANREVFNEQNAEIWGDFALQSFPTIIAPLQSQRYLPEIMLDKEDGITKANVNGTPTFIINNTRIDGAQPYEDFKKVLDTLLKSRPLERQ